MVSKVNSPKTLSPDGSGRFFMMAKILEAFHGGSKKKITLLDVGGGSPFMTHQLKDTSFSHDLTAIDILPKPAGFRGTYIEGDATKMPFNDGTFNTVITTDVLEHIPPAKKKVFVEECIRVAKDYVVIAAPFNSDGVDAAEHATNDFNTKLFGQGQPWLEEHFESKKPELDMVLETAKQLGCETELIGTNNLYNWVLSTHVNLIEAKLGLNAAQHVKSNLRANEYLLTSGDMTAPYYRHFIVIFKTSAPKKVKETVQQLASPVVDHSTSIAYFHDLMNLIADKMASTEAERKDLEIKLINEHKEAVSRQEKIETLEREITQLQRVIERCRPYLRVRGLTPKKILNKLSPNRKARK